MVLDTQYLGDGDSKCFDKVVDGRPCEDSQIEKLEMHKVCVKEDGITS
jgi:hypothetical protein